MSELVFDPVVHKLLDDVDVSVAGKLNGVTFDVDPNMAIMTDKGNAVEFTTPSGTGAKEIRTAFVDSLLGMLAQRQATWGALFNHPRTLIIGPGAAFVCENITETDRSKGKWTDATQLGQKGGKRRYVLDYDQVIWVNHCARGYEGPGLTRFSGWVMVPTLEIGVARLKQEQRTEADIPYEIGYARFTAGKGDVEYPPIATKKPEEWAALQKRLALTQLGSRDRYSLVAGEDPFPRLPDAVGSTGDSLEYALMAAVVLERLMRDRTTNLAQLLTWNRASDSDMALAMQRAVMSGQIPYAAADLDEAQRQPTVMPGQFTFDRVLEVMEHVTGGKFASPGAFFGSPAFSALSAGKPNPYARLGNSSSSSVAATLTACEAVEEEVDPDENPYARMRAGADPGFNSPGSLSPLSPESDSGDDGDF